jgi:NAD(P)H dehydrogenase (quinone)
MNVLIVHAHHEPQSFNAALARQAQKSLEQQGHSVTLSDLHSMNFQPVSDRRNFTGTKDAAYLKQQQEELHATQTQGFAPEIENEIQKVEAADAILFVYPLWWFGMPAIMKGWVDRVFAYGRIYGNGQLYENGIGKSKKRGLVIMTTGGRPDNYGGNGVNPAMESILTPVQHGIFWFNGILPLDPFIAWSPAHLNTADRAKILTRLDTRLTNLFTEAPVQLPPLADFPDWGLDSHSRFMVTATRTKPIDTAYTALTPAELAHVEQLKRQGILLNLVMTPRTAADWRAYLTIRATDRAEVAATLAQLPLATYLQFEIQLLA